MGMWGRAVVLAVQDTGMSTGLFVDTQLSGVQPALDVDGGPPLSIRLMIVIEGGEMQSWMESTDFM
jgi:hypothetical protein